MLNGFHQMIIEHIYCFLELVQDSVTLRNILRSLFVHKKFAQSHMHQLFGFCVFELPPKERHIGIGCFCSGTGRYRYWNIQWYGPVLLWVFHCFYQIWLSLCHMWLFLTTGIQTFGKCICGKLWNTVCKLMFCICVWSSFCVKTKRMRSDRERFYFHLH